jgi:hypothetical protein
MQLLRQKSVALATGFALGQGSVFLVNAGLLLQGRQASAGLLVAITACFSFTLLFADLANPTRLAQLIAHGDGAGIGRFLSGRAGIGCIAAAVLALVLMLQIVKLPQAAAVAASMGLAAAIYGATTVAFHEARGDYWRFALLQSAPWVVFASGAFAAFHWLGDDAAVLAVALMLPAIALAYRQAARVAYAGAAPSRRWHDMRSTFPYLVGPLLSQVWGRLVIVVLAMLYGARFLGEFGLFRQVEVAVILLFGFVLRPVIARISTERNPCFDGVDQRVMRLLQVAFGFTAVALLAYFAFKLLPLDLGPVGHAAWVDLLPLLAGVYLATVGLCFSQASQWLCDGPAMLRLEVAAQLANVAIFFALVFVSPLGAILLSESAQALIYRLKWLQMVKHEK